jgi:hypothetical protein
MKYIYLLKRKILLWMAVGERALIFKTILPISILTLLMFLVAYLGYLKYYGLQLETETETEIITEIITEIANSKPLQTMAERKEFVAMIEEAREERERYAKNVFDLSEYADQDLEKILVNTAKTIVIVTLMLVVVGVVMIYFGDSSE